MFQLQTVEFFMVVHSLTPECVEATADVKLCVYWSFLCVCVCVCVMLRSREDHLHRNECFASNRAAWLGGPGQEVHLRILSAAGQRALPRQEAAARGWVATIDRPALLPEIIDTLSAGFIMVTRVHLFKFCIAFE